MDFGRCQFAKLFLGLSPCFHLELFWSLPRFSSLESPVRLPKIGWAAALAVFATKVAMSSIVISLTVFLRLSEFSILHR